MSCVGQTTLADASVNPPDATDVYVSDAQALTDVSQDVIADAEPSGIDLFIPDVSVDGSLRDAFIEEVSPPLCRWVFFGTSRSLSSVGRVPCGAFELLGSASIQGQQGLILRSNSTGSPGAARLETLGLWVEESLKRNQSFSIRLWVRSALSLQNGPARIFTWSKDSNSRNITVGHGNSTLVPESHLIGRVRVGGLTNRNGVIVDADGVENNLFRLERTLDEARELAFITLQYSEQVLTFTHNADRRIRTLTPEMSGGILEGFDWGMGVLLGNEFVGGEPDFEGVFDQGWMGHVLVLEIDDRILSPIEIGQRISDGPQR